MIYSENTGIQDYTLFSEFSDLFVSSSNQILITSVISVNSIYRINNVKNI